MFLQRGLNVLNRETYDYADIDVDGHMGSGTLGALKKYLAVRGEEGEKVLVSLLNCLQGAFYVSLAEERSKDETFVFGWFRNRVQV
jgi:lysozyme family protein